MSALVATAAVVGTVVVQSLSSPSSGGTPSAGATTTASVAGGTGAAAGAAPRSTDGTTDETPQGGAAPAEHAEQGTDGTATQADGLLPAGVTASDTGYPGVAKLRPDLRAALRRAAAAAAAQGVRIEVTSGWRSAAYQDQLLRAAVGTYGTQAEAARWVASPTTSSHVSGSAADLGPAAATAWLSTHGAAYGLCRTYRNEPWHFELRAQAPKQGCPAMYADAAHDPRMRS